MHDALAIALLLLATAVVVVVGCRLLRLPALVGYLIVGILIGPHALAWVPNTEDTRYLAEFGVVFLMFSVGLEFSLPKLIAMRSVVFGLGAAQMFSTVTTVFVIALLVGLDWRAALALGGALAMSSTAILGKMLADRLELNSLHGRQIIGVALFQDLAVVPFLILIPAFAADPGTLAVSLGTATLKAALVLTLVLFAGQRVMRPWFHVVARRKSPELFMLNLLLFTLGLAWITRQMELSLALGAFLAGMLISETEYRYQVEQDIRPFQDVLLGLFFVTIGMELDLAEVAKQWIWVSVLLVLLQVCKTSLIVGISWLFERNRSTALRTGLALGGAGEFGLVLVSLAGQSAVLSSTAQQVVLAAMILSMLVSPFIIERSEHIVRSLNAAEWMNRAMAIHEIAARTMSAEQHIIICGYGRSGQNLARLLERESVPFIALDIDPQRVKEAAQAGEGVVFGDAARREVLLAAGLSRAKALVVTYADVASALKILALVHELRPGLPVIVRTRDDADIDRLKDAGAAEVVPEILEGSLMLASQALMLAGVPFNRVLRRIRETREHRYGLFRGFFRGVTDETGEEREAQQARLHSVTVSPGAWAVGKTLGDLNLPNVGVEVTALRRHHQRSVRPDQKVQLAVGDVLVLRGNEESLAAAEAKLLQG
ncbi:MAG TPA: cation:proton antiporter [Burkholderiales bacterium]|nr:cation:proton antiporter [Burkholderiales bacterium]